jgi:hypothetical protein
MYKLFKKPDRILGGVIEVFDVRSENDFKNRFLNQWSISVPFDNASATPKQLLFLSKNLSYSDVSSTFGHIDVGRMFPTDNLTGKCVIAISREVASGTLLFASTGQMTIIDEATGIKRAASNPAQSLKFYQETLELPQKQRVSSVFCANQKLAEFTVGYLEEQK